MKLKALVQTAIVLTLLFVPHFHSLAEDKNANRPNWNDPTKPYYMRGTRTDMAPKVEVPGTKEEDSFCEPSEGTKKLLQDADDSRWSDDPISGITHQWQVIQSRKVWDKECEEKQKQKKKTPSSPVWGPAK